MLALTTFNSEESINTQLLHQESMNADQSKVSCEKVKRLFMDIYLMAELICSLLQDYHLCLLSIKEMGKAL